MRRLFFLSWATVWAAVTSGCAVTHTGGPETPAPLPAPAAFDVQRDIVFTPADRPAPLKADVYRPRGEGLFPAVLVIHGGGWARGSRDEMAHVCKRLAAQGFVAVNVEYRFAPAFHFPAPVQDLQQALRWMRENAASQQIDVRHIGLWGYSAGAHLAALLGVLSPGDPNYVETLRAQAVVAGGTPVDLRRGADSPLIQQFIGRPIAEVPELYEQASPIAYVSKDDPPMFLYHGNLDAIVKETNAERMRDELNRVGVPAETYIIHGTGHIGAFFNNGAIDAGIGFLQRYLR